MKFKKTPLFQRCKGAGLPNIKKSLGPNFQWAYNMLLTNIILR